MSSNIKLYDTVALLEDMKEENLYRGQVGAVIEVWDTDVFEVEFSNSADGHTYAMLALNADKLLKLHFAPIESE